MRALVFRSHPHPALSDLPMMQVRCLHVIQREEGQKMHDLAAKMETTLPAMSQIVDRLVKRGMVERHNDPTDRRVVRLRLSPEAQTTLEEARQGRDARLEATLTHLEPDALAKVIEGLRLLAGAAERMTEAEPPQDHPEGQGGENPAGTPLDGGDPLVEMMAQRRARNSSGARRSSSAPVPPGIIAADVEDK